MASSASMDQSLVGIIANPASGRDVRRLVAKASVFPHGGEVQHGAARPDRAGVVRRALGGDDEGSGRHRSRGHARAGSASHPGLRAVAECCVPRISDRGFGAGQRARSGADAGAGRRAHHGPGRRRHSPGDREPLRQRPARRALYRNQQRFSRDSRGDGRRSRCRTDRHRCRAARARNHPQQTTAR